MVQLTINIFYNQWLLINLLVMPLYQINIKIAAIFDKMAVFHGGDGKRRRNVTLFTGCGGGGGMINLYLVRRNKPKNNRQEIAPDH
jgi:hypothetical protein